MMNDRVLYTAMGLLITYILASQYFRVQRSKHIQHDFTKNGALSLMAVREAREIIRTLRELEFPFAMHFAMKLSLLKV